MNTLNKIIKYFTPFEWLLWLGGLAVIFIAFLVGSDKGYMAILSLFSSFFGISCVIFNAKGNVSGQVLSIIFAIIYAVLAYFNHYYGEMIIYLALMLPIHIASIVSWIKNPNKNAEHTEVQINTISAKDYLIFATALPFVVCGFYFLLYALKTDNLIVSTISLVTSLGAAYFMLRRCEYFALFFIANDVILIILWSMKLSTDGAAVIPSIISFALFLINDSYSFFNWKRIKHRQKNTET